MKLKRYIFSALLCATPMLLGAQAPELHSDTLAVIRNAHNVTVTKTPTANNITVIGSGDDRNFYYSFSTERDDSIVENSNEWGLSLPFLREEKRRKSEVIWGAHVQIGFCFPVDGPKGLDQSIDLALGKVVGVNYTPWSKGPTFSMGAGLFAQKFALHGSQMFGRDGKSLVIMPLPEEAGNSHVRLYNFGFETPFTITQNIYHGFSFSTGIVVKFNTYTTASNKYKIGNRCYEQSIKDLQQRILTYDIFGAIGWEDFGLYFRYSPVSLFKSSQGPRFDVISFGINLGF